MTSASQLRHANLMVDSGQNLLDLTNVGVDGVGGIRKADWLSCGADRAAKHEAPCDPAVAKAIGARVLKQNHEAAPGLSPLIRERLNPGGQFMEGGKDRGD